MYPGVRIGKLSAHESGEIPRKNLRHSELDLFAAGTNVLRKHHDGGFFPANFNQSVDADTLDADNLAQRNRTRNLPVFFPNQSDRGSSHPVFLDLHDARVNRKSARIGERSYRVQASRYRAG